MPRCRNCNFDLAHHDERAGSRRFCDRCNELACWLCGCTETTPCARGDRACSWAPVEQVLQLAMFTGEEPAPMCTFCVYAAVEQLYAQASGNASQVLAVEQGGLVQL